MRSNGVDPRAPVCQIEPTDTARALSTLSRIDYADMFVVDSRRLPARTGEQWARLVLDEAPNPLRESLPGSWRALGPQHGRPSDPGFVLGWPLAYSGPDHALLAAKSRVGMPAQLLFQPTVDQLVFATFVQHNNPAARVMWASMTNRHTGIVSQLLGDALGRAGNAARPGSRRAHDDEH